MAREMMCQVCHKLADFLIVENHLTRCEKCDEVLMREKGKAEGYRKEMCYGSDTITDY